MSRKARHGGQKKKYRNRQFSGFALSSTASQNISDASVLRRAASARRFSSGALSEPGVALRIFESWVRRDAVDVVYGERLERASGVSITPQSSTDSAGDIAMRS